MAISSSASFLGGILFRHWPAKIGALVLAAVLFVFTRDEVTRTFDIPLRVVPDTERVLLTDLPETVQVQVRGPWTRLNRLHGYDFGAAMLDLRTAQPGPLEVDRASIVMPAGVVLAGVLYDHVDLRFEPIVQRTVEIVPTVVGQPASRHRLVLVEVEPATWAVRGGRSQVDRVTQIATEPVDIGGAVERVEARVDLVPPPADVRLVESESGPARVRVQAIVEPTTETRDFRARVPQEALEGPGRVLESSYRVRVSGPAPVLASLDELRIDDPVTAMVDHAEVDGATVLEVRFEWDPRVPSEIRDPLRFDRGVIRVPVPTASARADD